MEPKELNTLLLDKFPNLKDAFEKEASWQDGIDTGSTVIFEDVFMPYIIYCVEHSLDDEVQKIFAFVEECITSKDEYQKNVIEVAVIENIHSYDIADKLSSHLLPMSLLAYSHC